MTKEAHIDDREHLAAYLLGELNQDQQLALEREYFTNDAAYEQLRIVEDELAYEYAEERLSAQQRQHFETTIGATERGRENVAFARSLLRVLRASEAPLRRTRAWLPAAAAAVVIAIPLTWLTIRFANLDHRKDQISSRPSTAPVTTANVETSYALTVARTRANGGLDRLEILPQVTMVRLELIAPGGTLTAGDFMITLHTADSEVWKQTTRFSGKGWEIRVPAQIFTTGDYEISVQPLGSNEPSASSTYYLRILRK